MPSHHINRGIEKFLELLDDPNVPEDIKWFVANALDNIALGVEDLEQQILDLQSQLLRNLSFPGDLMGFWDDDIPEEEDDETE